MPSSESFPNSKAAAPISRLQQPVERYEPHLPHDKRFVAWVIARARPTHRQLYRLMRRFDPGWWPR